jgi:23S rRNA (pseudouridine1915-N3)-methyltransferase
VRIHVIAIGQKMPDWVEAAGDDFIRRMPPEIVISLNTLPLIRRGKNPDIKRIVRDESRKLLDAVPAGARLIALDVKGNHLSSEKLAAMMRDWLDTGTDIAFVIGGPDGLSEELLQRAERKISLSKLTFPHALVRVILVEQLYRAWSILNNHPYHRA